MRIAIGRAVLAVILGISSAAAYAQSTRGESRWSLVNENVRTNWFDIVPSGADLGAQYLLPPFARGLDTFAEIDVGGGYVQNVFFRNQLGEPLNGPYTTAQTTFNQSEFLGAIGLRQGLLFNAGLGKNRLEAFGFYRLHYNYDYQSSPEQLVFQASSFPDRTQILSNSILAGFDYDTIRYDLLHKVRRGTYAELSAEWGPGFLFNSIGQSDYLRFNLTSKTFRTLYTSDVARRMNRFSIYAGDYFSADWATGSSIPIFVMQTFGGRLLVDGLGQAVRGFEEGGWDTNFKAVNSLELRATGPAIYLPSIVPGLFVFFDSGYYGGGYARSAVQENGGFLASVGTGAYLVTIDLVNITLYIAFPVYGKRIDGAPYEIATFFHLDF